MLGYAAASTGNVIYLVGGWDGTQLLSSNLAFVTTSPPSFPFIHILSNGTVVPTEGIQRDGDLYSFTADINGQMVIQRNGTIVDGKGHALRGLGSRANGLTKTFHSNVTIKNTVVEYFYVGIRGVLVNYIPLWSNDLVVSGNTIGNNYVGIHSAFVNCTTISNNTIVFNDFGISLLLGHNNTISGNTIQMNNDRGINLILCNDSKIFHNNFVDNTEQVFLRESYNNKWDDGYPSGGNYWSDYNGTDLYSGTYQNESGSDGIGDTPYIIDEYNQDNYSLMTPINQTNIQNLNVTKGPASHIVQIVSNATIVNFNVTPGSIMLSVSGETGSTAYVKIVQPFSLNASSINVFLNHTRLTFPSYDPTATISTNATHYSIYFIIVFQSFYDVSVQFTVTGDITGNEFGIPDGTVDMRDVGFAARRFGINNTHSLWSDHADITGPVIFVADSKVDMRDIGLIAIHFGETYP